LKELQWTEMVYKEQQTVNKAPPDWGEEVRLDNRWRAWSEQAEPDDDDDMKTGDRCEREDNAQGGGKY
jgi:hypothetical protein